jgi:hypothetical protein
MQAAVPTQQRQRYRSGSTKADQEVNRRRGSIPRDTPYSECAARQGFYFFTHLEREHITKTALPKGGEADVAVVFQKK